MSMSVSPSADRRMPARPRGGAPRELTEYERGRVVSMLSDVQSLYKRRDALYSKLRSIRFLEEQVKIPENYKAMAIESKSPFPHEIVSKITAALSVNPARVTFDPVTVGEAGRENATKRKRWSEGARERQERDANRRHLRMVIDSAVTYGMGVLKTVYRPDAWSGYNKFIRETDERLDREYGAWLDPGSEALRKREREFDRQTEEYKRGAPFPIRTTDVHPMDFYRWHGEDDYVHDFEWKTVPYLSTLQKYGLAPSRNDELGLVQVGDLGRPMHDWGSFFQGKRLHLVEHWTPEYIDYLIVACGVSDTGKSMLDATALSRATLARRVRNPYGQSPFFPTFGVSTSDSEPAYEGVSVLFGVLHLFPLLDSLLTIKSGNAYLSGYPAFKERATPLGNSITSAPMGTEGIEDTEEQTIEPGHIYRADVDAIQLPETGRDMTEMIGMLLSMLDRVLPPITQGMTGGGDQFGVAVNQLITAARLAWDPIVDNLEFMLAANTGFQWWLVENRIKEAVYVEEPTRRGVRGTQARGWVSLAPEDVDGKYRCIVKLDPVLPTNKILELRYHVEMVKAGFETEAMAIEDLGNNPDEVEEGRLVEELKRDPAIRAELRRRTLQFVIGNRGKANDLEAAAAGVLGDNQSLPQGDPSAMGNAMNPQQPGLNAPIAQPASAGAIPSNPSVPGAPAGPQVGPPPPTP